MTMLKSFRRRPLFMGLLFSCLLGFFLAEIVVTTGCTNQVTLEKGGAYSDPVLAVTDQSILDASKAIQGFLGWYDTNKAFLDKYPEVTKLADSTRSNEKGWIKDAYNARDTYGSAAQAYKQTLAAGTDPSTTDAAKQKADATHAALNAAISVLNNLIAQINAYRAAHATS